MTETEEWPASAAEVAGRGDRGQAACRQDSPHDGPSDNDLREDAQQAEEIGSLQLESSLRRERHRDEAARRGQDALAPTPEPEDIPNRADVAASCNCRAASGSTRRSPPATTNWASRAMSAWAALFPACSPEPQRRLMVWPGTSTGSPAMTTVEIHLQSRRFSITHLLGFLGKSLETS